MNYYCIINNMVLSNDEKINISKQIKNDSIQTIEDEYNKLIKISKTDNYYGSQIKLGNKIRTKNSKSGKSKQTKQSKWFHLSYHGKALKGRCLKIQLKYSLESSPRDIRLERGRRRDGL